MSYHAYSEMYFQDVSDNLLLSLFGKEQKQIPICIILDLLHTRVFNGAFFRTFLIIYPGQLVIDQCRN